MRPLDHVLKVIDEVVAQVVEAELVVGAVGDIAAIGALAVALGQAVDDHANAHAEEFVDLPHPLRVAAGEIVVHSDEVHAFAGEGVEVEGQGGDKSLAFPRAHFRDAALVQHHAADELDVEVAHAERALGRLPHHGEGFFEQLVDGLAGGEPLAELRGLGLQLRVAERRHLRLQGVDRRHAIAHHFDLAVVGGAEKLSEQRQHRISELPAGDAFPPPATWDLRRGEGRRRGPPTAP